MGEGRFSFVSTKRQEKQEKVVSAEKKNDPSA
jgi:hypothetical protein